MTPQDILDDAQLAGFIISAKGITVFPIQYLSVSNCDLTELITKFAELRNAGLNTKLDEVRAKEREGCAELLDAINTKRTSIVSAALATAAHAIRTRTKP